MIRNRILSLFPSPCDCHRVAEFREWSDVARALESVAGDDVLHAAVSPSLETIIANDCAPELHVYVDTCATATAIGSAGDEIARDLRSIASRLLAAADRLDGGNGGAL